MANVESLTMSVDDIPFATDGLSQPSVFADYIRGAMVSGGVAKLNLIDNRVDAIKNEVRSVHVLTIVTPVHQLRAWARFLESLADQQGVPPLDASAIEALQFGVKPDA